MKKLRRVHSTDFCRWNRTEQQHANARLGSIGQRSRCQRQCSSAADAAAAAALAAAAAAAHGEQYVTAYIDAFASAVLRVVNAKQLYGSEIAIAAHRIIELTSSSKARHSCVVVYRSASRQRSR